MVVVLYEGNLLLYEYLRAYMRICDILLYYLFYWVVDKRIGWVVCFESVKGVCSCLDKIQKKKPNTKIWFLNVIILFLYNY